MRKINKLVNSIAKSIVRKTEMSDSVAILALSESINCVPVAGYAIKIGPDSKALGFSEKTGGKITATENAMTFDNLELSNLIGAYVEAMERLKYPSTVFVLTESVDTYDALIKVNPNQDGYYRSSDDIINGISEDLNLRLNVQLGRHTVTIRLLEKAQKNWASVLRGQMYECVERHIHAEWERMKTAPKDTDVRYAATNHSTTDAKRSFEDFPKSFTFDELEKKDAHAASNKQKMKLIPREYTVDEDGRLC